MDTYETYKAVFEASPDAIIIADDRGEITMVNKQAVKLFGFVEEEMLGKEIEMVIPNRYHTKHKKERKAYVAHPVVRGMGAELDIFAKRKDGGEFPVEISLSPINLKGKIYVAAAIRDVTERKQMEAKLLENEKKYHTTLDNMLEGVMILDFDFRFVYINNANVKQSKYKREELLGYKLTERFPGIEETELFKNYLRCMTERVSNQFETEFIFPDNSIGWFEISVQPVPEGIFVLIIEITERKLAEEKIKASEQLLAESQKVANIGSWEWDIAGNKIIWSDELYRIYDLCHENFAATYEGYLQHTVPEEREYVNNLVQQAFKNKQPFSFYHNIIRPSGETRILYEEGAVVVDNTGEPVMMHGVAADVTERKKAEQEIANQKRFIEEVLNNIPADIAVFDGSHNYIFINPTAISNAETRRWLMGKNDFDYCRLKGISDSLAQKRRAFFDKAVQTKSDAEWIDEHQNKDGKTLYILRKFHPVFENDQLKHVIGYGIDITDLKTTGIKLSEAIVAAQKAYKELEQFSYTVSHDLQEPLRMVRGFLDLLKSETEELLDESAKEYIFYAIDGAERMKILIHDLLNYSRVGTNKEDFTDVDVNAVLKEVKHVLLQNLEDPHPLITVHSLPVIRGNKTLLYQLFLNLVSNAIKYNDKSFGAKIEVGCSEQADTYTFYVKDNGIGIDPTYFEKIFVIFHRLHGRSEYSGTGIGLAICKKIVQSHGGKIWLESSLGLGSTFYFTISRYPI